MNSLPSPTRIFHWLGGLVGIAFMSLLPPLSAQTTGAVSGVVTDSSGSLLPGASVTILGTQLATSTDRLGRYRLQGVAPGEQRVTVDYLGYDPQTGNVMVAAGQDVAADFSLKSDTLVLETFVVESIREGQSRAINQQRSANTIKNIISADAIGNLPDRTVGEALGRLPGVNVVDDSFASIRGTSAENNSVTLDGDRFTTSGSSVESTQTQTDSRAVDLSLIPSEMIGGIEVIKALTADMDADSFGGTINLVTRSAFELKERSINGKFEYLLNDFRNKDGIAGSLTYLDVLNEARTLGVSATLAYRQEEKMTNAYEFAYHAAGAIPVGTSGSGTPRAITAVGDEGLEEYDTRLNFEDSTKLGATVNLDWKLSPATELHFRTFYENSEKTGNRFRNRARALSRWDASSTAARQSGQQVRLQSVHEDGVREQDVMRLGLDGQTKLESGTLEYGLKYGDSTLTAKRERYIFDYLTNTERRRYAWVLDRTDPKLPVFTLTNIASGQNGLTNPADRQLGSIRFHTGTDDESDLTASMSYVFTRKIANRSIDWKVGAKHRGKDRSSRPSIQDFTPVAGTSPFFTAFPVFTEPQNLLDGSQRTMGPFVSLPAVISYFNTNRASFNAAPGSEINRLEARKYDVSEDILASFAMASTKFDKLEVIAGIRWEQTKTSYNWLADPGGASKGSRSYGDIYPSLILNYRFSQNLIARFAYTNTLSRPSYGDLIPYRIVTDDTQAESGTGGLAPGDYPETNKVFLGNAQLNAQQAENFDLSLEYYIQPTGLVSLALFRKDLKDVIFRSQFKDPTDANTIFFQERNGSSGQVEGLELSWQQALSFLPSPLDGLGINLNATFINGSSVLEELTPGTSSTYRPLLVDFLPEQPETVYNAQVWWEKYGFTARVAVNYVDEFVRTSGGRTSFSVNDKAIRWDASLSYRLTENFTIYAEGKNLTEEVSSWYATTPNRPEDYTFTGATYTCGVKFRF